MKAAIGKAVDGENVAVVRVQPVAELLECRGLGEFARGEIAEAQTNGVRLAVGDLIAHGQGVALKRIEGFGPILAAMDIGAIGEVEAVVEFHVRRKLARKTEGE